MKERDKEMYDKKTRSEKAGAGGIVSGLCPVRISNTKKYSGVLHRLIQFLNPNSGIVILKLGHDRFLSNSFFSNYPTTRRSIFEVDDYVFRYIKS
jgi:hypothetical protein